MAHEFNEKRRSHRLQVTIPLRFEVADSRGQTFEYEGRAISLNRHGARIQTSQALERGQAIRLRSPIGRFEADFRVVEPIDSRDEEIREYGIECLNEEENFWGIEFPAEPGDAADARVLLECRICHAIALMPLTLSELKAVSTLGMVGKNCRTCTSETPWRYAELRVPPQRDPRLARNSIDRHSNSFSLATYPVERGHRRVYMQMPIEVRDWQGQAEVARTENVSKCGFCFSSEKKYLPGEIIMVLLPLDSATQTTELAARIVREQFFEGADNKIYGATFEPVSYTKNYTESSMRHAAA